MPASRPPYPYFPLRFRADGRGGALGSVLGLFLLLLLAAAAYLLWYVRQPLDFAPDVKGSRLVVEIPAGSSASHIASIVSSSGVQVQPLMAQIWLRLHATELKAGIYEIPRGANLQTIVTKLHEGQQTLLSITIPEGWNLHQVRAHLLSKQWLKQDSAHLSDAQLVQALGLPAGSSLEGMLAPDTYRYSPGSSDLVFYKQAERHMQKNLQEAWAQRSANAQVQTPEQALILASLIEKETGNSADRAMIAGVFNNRLRLGMPLQTDPTVIYGLGASYRGTLYKSDLQGDTPYNTYVHAGLPPTPIAMPGKAALLAAVQPAATTALYFVAKGDGSGQSQFSNTLAQHHEAVRVQIPKNKDEKDAKR